MALNTIAQVATDAAPGTAVYTAPANTKKLVIGLLAANKTGAAATIKLYWRDVSDANKEYVLVPDVVVPANTTLDLFAGFKPFLDAGDILFARASANATIDLSGVITDV